MNRVTVGTFNTTNLMREKVNAVLDSGRISYGPMSKEFESRFSDIHGCKFGVLSNSGTSSLQVALQALKELHGWQDGDEVIVPAVTFVATANIVLHNRMKPVLCDIDPLYYELDPVKLIHKITGKTRAIIPVHLFGQPCDMQSIADIAKQNKLKVIEDSCECMFVSHRGTPAGAWGDIGCFSTYVAHLLTTGVGGIATTNNPDYAAKMRSLVNHGRDGIYISIDDNDPNNLEQVVSRRFSFESVGHSFRITELEAAIGLAQLDNFDEMIARRNDNAARLTSGLLELENKGYLHLPQKRLFTEHAFMMYPIVLRGDKWPLCNFLEESNVETREMLPLTRQPCYSGLWNPDDYNVADWINKSGFYIGCHQDLTDEQLDYAIEKIREYFSA